MFSSREIKDLAREIVAEQMRYEVIGADEAAKILGITKRTLYNNIEDIPHGKVFGKLRFFRADLIKMITR